MRRFHRLTNLAVLIALCGALSGCGGGGLGNFDPSDLLDFLDTKKKLPGERKPVFPEGVPGLTPGVPKELYKGAQAEPEPPPQIAPSEEKPKGRKATKSRSAVRVAPPEANVSDEGEPAAVPATPAAAKPKVLRRRTTALPAEPASEPAPAPIAAAPRSAPAPAQSPPPFPAPLPSGSFSR